jgi:hypothetical protein
MRLSSRFGVVPLCCGLLAASAAVPGLVGCGGGSGGTGMGGAAGGATGSGGTGGGAVACSGAIVTPTEDCPTTDIIAPSGSFPMGAACGEQGEATASACAYEGHEDLIVIGDDGLGDPVCQIRFTVKRVGNAPAGCRYMNHDTAMQTNCGWTQTVEYSNPVIMVNVNNACANSGFALSSAKIDQMDGCRVAIGYAPNCGDHDSACRMKYRVSQGGWDPVPAPGGLSYCTAEAAAKGDCSPADKLTYNPRAACTYQ